MVVGLLTKCASFWSESASGAIFRAVTQQQGGVLSDYPLYRGKILSQAESTAKCLTLSEPHEEEVTIDRLEICRDRWDRRSCKIFPNCVKFWGNNANSLGNYRVIYALNE